MHSDFFRQHNGNHRVPTHIPSIENETVVELVTRERAATDQQQRAFPAKALVYPVQQQAANVEVRRRTRRAYGIIEKKRGATPPGRRSGACRAELR